MRHSENAKKIKLWRYPRNSDRALLELNPIVFGCSTLLILGFVILSLTYLDDFSTTVKHLQHWIATEFGWLFVLAVNLMLGYLVFLALSPYGTIKLGGKDSQPDFNRWAWFAMLFSAGMGIGLMFYSIAEPMFHLVNPPHGATPYTVAAYEDAIKTTFLHWGLHAWGIYTLMALGLAFFSYNLKQPLSIRSLFQPLFGDRIYSWPGHTIDTLATVATLFGVATSLGLGATQINAGLNHLFGIPVGETTQILLIIFITSIATLSVVLGLKKGIQRLSTANISIATLLMLFVLLVGPTLFIANGIGENIGLYLNDFFKLGFWNETYTRGDWQNGWTVFYWGWWIAWSPFVGMFIARISKGRTIREFIAMALIASTLTTFVWLSIFGNTALYIELSGPGGLADAVVRDLPRSLFVFFEKLPLVSHLHFPDSLQTLIGIIACVVVISFFVTSSDSGSLVVDIITAGGHPNPPVAQRIYWASMEGIVAIVLLAGGGLTALQTAAISSGLPFLAIMLLMIFCLHKALASHVRESAFTASSDQS